MKVPPNLHNRPIKLETCIYADSQGDLVHALEVLLSNAKRDDFIGNGKVSGVSSGSETSSVIRIKR